MASRRPRGWLRRVPISVGLLGVLGLLSLAIASCGGGAAPKYKAQATPTPTRPVAELARLAAVKPGQPVLVFVYTDG